MTNNLNRLFYSLIEIPKPKLELGFVVSNPSIVSAWTSTRRGFVCSPGQQQQEKSPEEDISHSLAETKEEIETPTEDMNEAEEEDEEEYEFVNSETGEIGGPRGPEPTRYGDWERGGRCSDF